jgi:hypothetical protein
MDNRNNIDFDYYSQLFKSGKSYEYIKKDLRQKGLDEASILEVINIVDRQLFNEARKKAENGDLLYYFVGGGLVAVAGLVICLNTTSYAIARIVSYLMMFFGIFAIFIGMNKKR